MFIDMHHHFVYGIDDGAQSLDDMKSMLTLAWQQGAKRIVATPHATPGQHPFHMSRFNRHFQAALDYIEEQGMELRLYRGCEIFYTDGTARLLSQGEIPTIGDSRYVLVEFSPDAPIDRLRQAARSLGMVGYQPIFAHVERYACLRKLDYVQELHTNYEVIMQVNAATVAKGGLFTARWLDKMMDGGYIDLISSDAHNTKARRFMMKEAYAVLKRDFDRPIARALCHDNALRILKRCQEG